MFECCFPLDAFILLYQSDLRAQMETLQFRVCNMAVIHRVHSVLLYCIISVTTKAVSARARVLQTISFIFFSQLT